jgi:hypothetical protein
MTYLVDKDEQPQDAFEVIISSLGQKSWAWQIFFKPDFSKLITESKYIR